MITIGSIIKKPWTSMGLFFGTLVIFVTVAAASYNSNMTLQMLPEPTTLTIPSLAFSDVILSSEVTEYFPNTTNYPEFGKQENAKYRKYQKHRGGYAFASAGAGNGAWASTGNGAWASTGNGWVGGRKGKPNFHYNPSVNKYGGGGPIGGPKPNKPGRPPLKPNLNVPNSRLPGRPGGGSQTPVNQDDHRVSNAEEAIELVICTGVDECQDFVACGSQSYAYLSSQSRCCIQNRRGYKGICCNFPGTPNENSNSFNPYSTEFASAPQISEHSLRTAAEKAYEYKNKYKATTNQLLELNLVVERGTAAFGHLQFFKTTPEVLHMAEDNFLAVKTANYLQEAYFLSNYEAGVGLQIYDYSGTVFEKTCPRIPTCRRFSKYRTLDGSCNNPTSPKLGQHSTPLIRLLPPDYADGIWAPRVSKNGGPLPSPRFVTLNLVPDSNRPDRRYSHMLMQFGQFVDHDLTHVPIFRFDDLSGIDCCAQLEYGLTHPACMPIEIPSNDFVYRGQSCMNFVRSMVSPRLDCSFGHADQLNQLTHWLDASQIYGSTVEQTAGLREFSGGRLRISSDSGREYLPEDHGGQDEDCGFTVQSNGHCFVAGDKRVNEQIGLTSMHTIFVREHNRIAAELSFLNPFWNDEILFQETRRIVIAEYQHILYNEWLPLIIGREYMETFGILPSQFQRQNSYDSSVDASISNAFATAAFRMGHTLVQGVLQLNSGGPNPIGGLVLRNVFNDPSLLPENNVLDSLTEGLLSQPIQQFDNHVTTELRDHLFETPRTPGFDLIALNIQRGRDHGLPSYNEYRDLCRLGKARNFRKLSPIINPDKIFQLQSIYGNVDDIDLFIGGLFETPLPGAVVGPTFACIIGDQFVRLKNGDAYFYEHSGHPHSFTNSQLRSIKRTSLSRILCDNTNIQSVQPLAFHLKNPLYNPALSCQSRAMPYLDLRPWRE